MQSLQIVAYGEPLAATETTPTDPGPGEIVVAVQAAGICRSDVHYRSGTRPLPTLPRVPGHEVAGVVRAVGNGVDSPEVGDRVALHYLVTCGECAACRVGGEQFCDQVEMIGVDRDGGYAEEIVIPARNAHRVPEGVSTDAAAVMMCSTSTSLHALRRGRLERGDAVGIFGAGGLGMSAIQLALAFGADPVVAVDVNPVKLERAAELGAVPIDGRADVVGRVRSVVPQGLDIGLELVGSAPLMGTILRCLAFGGRGVAVGITHEEFGVDPYRDLVTREAELVGAADHLGSEIEELLDMAAAGRIDVGPFVTNRIPLEVDEVNSAMDRLDAFGDDIRTVISRD